MSLPSLTPIARSRRRGLSASNGHDQRMSVSVVARARLEPLMDHIAAPLRKVDPEYATRETMRAMLAP
jgi:hypothetical protein